MQSISGGIMRTDTPDLAYITIEAVAARLGIDTQVVHHWIRDDRVKHFRTGNGTFKIDPTTLPTLTYLTASREQVKETLALVDHLTWIYQRLKYKGVVTGPNEQDVIGDDRDRAERLLTILETLSSDNAMLTRSQVITVLAVGEHEIWMQHRQRSGQATLPEHQEANQHDRERAENALTMLETLHKIRAICLVYAT